MPKEKETNPKYEGFKTLIQHLGEIESLNYRLTMGWTVTFENHRELPGQVIVTFYYNNKSGVDGRSLMFVICDLSTVADIFIKAATVASEKIKQDPKQYKGCYGVGVFRELCALRDQETKK